MDGTLVDDSKFISARESHEKLIVDGMGEVGYIPVLGMGPFFSTSFNAERGDYDLVISAYGVFVGEGKAWRLEGMDLETGTIYPKSTRPSKSKQS